MLFWPCSNHVLDTSEKSAGAGQSHSCEDCEGDGDCEPYSLVFCCSGFKVIEEPPRRTRQVDIRKYYPFSCVSLPVTRKVDSPTTKIIKKKVVKAAMATAAMEKSPPFDEWQQQNLHPSRTSL